MDQPLVSVVVATYNTADYVPDAVASVLAQTWQNLEVIIVDDGSTDDTQAVLQDSISDPRVHYIKTENRGQPRAKNRGIHESKGEFVAFCDADDLWRSNKLELQIPEFENPRVGVVYTDVSYLDENSIALDKKQPYTRHSGWVTHELAIRNFVPFGTAVIRRSCIEQDGMFDEALPMGIDWDLWLRYSVKWEFRHIPEQTYYYRVWPGQMSSNYRGRYENAFRILSQFIDQHPGALTKPVINRAWSDMYVNRGMYVARAEGVFFEPLMDVLRGLRKEPWYWPAWKSLIKLLIRRLR
ncbi:glycosyltransferase involved in cell wall biosynthesis [Halospina denitrificans]|uniref:Glycosyltransferase involved in cell wall biosynthesis n=1 Tax=Halospina denitrificans TaxID=332522 RepID=A0A4R7JRL2_9GAMM|nr:glycosyltransferase [Halospina denitrificans]TDT39479.1 glycosyltransferase involved in cell wall biosynthesis [Halospina denitrificans]